MNYKDKVLSGEVQSWQRAKRVVIENPLELTPVISFIEEHVTALPDGTHIKKDVGQVHQYFNAPQTTFSVLNPETGQAIRSSTYQEVYELLASLYFHLAQARDAAPVTQPEPQE